MSSGGYDGYDQEEDPSSTLFRDVIMLALAGFVTLVMLIIPHINPVAVAEDSAPSAGNMTVELIWPEKINADMDLWVMAPKGRPVGYSHKSGHIFNLLRDDLGSHSDMTELNYEFAYSRGAPEGEYVVNVHAYRNINKEYPIPVTVVVSLKKPKQKTTKQILMAKREMSFQGEELTVFRFLLNEDAELIKASVNDVPKKLRNLKK